MFQPTCISSGGVRIVGVGVIRDKGHIVVGQAIENTEHELDTFDRGSTDFFQRKLGRERDRFLRPRVDRRKVYRHGCSS